MVDYTIVTESTIFMLSMLLIKLVPFIPSFFSSPIPPSYYLSIIYLIKALIKAFINY